MPNMEMKKKIHGADDFICYTKTKNKTDVK